MDVFNPVLWLLLLHMYTVHHEVITRLSNGCDNLVTTWLSGDVLTVCYHSIASQIW